MLVCTDTLILQFLLSFIHKTFQLLNNNLENSRINLDLEPQSQGKVCIFGGSNDQIPEMVNEVYEQPCDINIHTRKTVEMFSLNYR